MLARHLLTEASPSARKDTVDTRYILQARVPIHDMYIDLERYWTLFVYLRKTAYMNKTMKSGNANGRSDYSYLYEW